MTIRELKEKGFNNLHMVTHWKSFHADDVTAASLLQYFLVEKLSIFKDAKLSRVDYNKNSGEVLQEKYNNENTYCMVFDVGRKYDPSNGLFDHHQFTKEEDGRASAGMVFDWLVSEGAIDDALKLTLGPIIRMVDDNDIGVKPASIGELSWIIRHMNEPYDSDDRTHMAAFLKAMETVMSIIRSLDRENEDLKATREAVANAGQTLPSSDLKFIALEFDNFPKGWQKLVGDGTIPKNVDVIIWYNEPDDTWQAQTVNKSEGSFEKRGRAIKVDEDYISDPKNKITFVHKGEFFMVAKTRLAIMKYLELYLK